MSLGERPPSAEHSLTGFAGPSSRPTTLAELQRLQEASLADREGYWRSQASRLRWSTAFTQISDEELREGRVRWFSGGQLKATDNVFGPLADAGRLDLPALLVSLPGGGLTPISYRELQSEVLALAAALAARGLQPGDRLACFLPDGQAAIALALACAHLGLIEVPVNIEHPFDVAHAILANCDASLLVIAGEDCSGGVGGQLQDAFGPERTVVVGHAADPRSPSYADLLAAGRFLPPPPAVAVDAEHPLCLLYPGAGTSIPRGAVFATGGFLVQAGSSYDDLFCLAGPRSTGDALLCTLPLASAAGLAYGLWGPLLHGACLVLSPAGEGLAATALAQLAEACPGLALLCSPRLLARLRQELGEGHLPASAQLGLVAACGDVLPPRLVAFAGAALTGLLERVLNLWIQRATGVALIASLPAGELNRPGALGLAALGVEPRVLNDAGEVCRPNESGLLVFASSWPAMVRGLWGQPERYWERYFSRIPGCFVTNDGARVDGEGFFWGMGRLDDRIKVAGRSLSTSEVESTLAGHPRIAEAAVVGFSGDEGGSLVSFLVARELAVGEDEPPEAEGLRLELARYLQMRLGEFAVPARLVFVRELPRTRSGKVVRRVLRRIATGDVSQDEDWSAVANPGALQDLVRQSGR